VTYLSEKPTKQKYDVVVVNGFCIARDVTINKAKTIARNISKSHNNSISIINNDGYCVAEYTNGKKN